MLGSRFADDGADDIATSVVADVEPNVKINFETNAQTDNEHNLQQRRNGAGVGRDRKHNRHNLQ